MCDRTMWQERVEWGSGKVVWWCEDGDKSEGEINRGREKKRNALIAKGNNGNVMRYTPYARRYTPYAIRHTLYAILHTLYALRSTPYPRP